MSKWAEFGYPALDIVDMRIAAVGYILAAAERTYEPVLDVSGILSWERLTYLLRWADDCLFDGYFYAPETTLADIVAGTPTAFDVDYIASKGISFSKFNIYDRGAKSNFITRNELLARYQILNLKYKRGISLILDAAAADAFNLYAYDDEHPAAVGKIDYRYGVSSGTMGGGYTYYTRSKTVAMRRGEKIILEQLPPIDTSYKTGGIIADYSVAGGYNFLDLES